MKVSNKIIVVIIGKNTVDLFSIYVGTFSILNQKLIWHLFF